MLKFCSLLFALAFCSINLSSQPIKCEIITDLLWENSTFSYFNSENGLPQNEVLDLHFSENDFLWIATQNGLVRYDGRGFKTFDPSNSSIIENARVRGFYRYDTLSFVQDGLRNCILINEPGLTISPAPVNLIDRYDFFPKGNYALKTYTQLNPLRTILRQSDSSFYSKRVHNSYLFYQENSCVYPMALNTTENFELFYFELEGRSFYLHNGLVLSLNRMIIDTVGYNPIFKKVSNNTSSATGQLLWSKTNTTPYVIDSDKLYEIILVDNKVQLKLILRDLPKDRYHCVYVAEEHESIFLGTVSNGLLQVSKKSIHQINSSDSCNRILRHYALAEIGMDQVITTDGNLYTENEYFCNSIFPYENAMDFMYHDKKSRRLYVQNIDLNRFGYYLDTNLSKFHFFQPMPNPFVTRSVKTMIRLDNYHLLILVSEFGLMEVAGDSIVKLIELTEIKSEYPNHLKQYGGEIYLGNHTGLRIIDLDSLEVDSVNILNNIQIRSIAMHKNILWITTYGKGIFIKKKQEWFRFNPDNYPELAYAHTVLFKNGYAYITSNSGLFRFMLADVYEYLNHPEEALIQGYSYTKRDGLYFNEFNGGYHPSGIEISSGEMVLPTLKGIIKTDPNNQPDPFIQNNIYVDEIEVDGVLMPVTDEVGLAADYQTLSLSVKHPFYGNSCNAQIYYRILGVLDKWVSFDPNEKISLNRLGYGKRTIEFKIVGAKSNETIEGIVLNIEPKVYEKRSFWIVLVFLLVLFIFQIVRFSKIKVRKRNKELEGLIARRTQELSNSLSTLNLTVDQLTKSEDELKNAVSMRNKLLSIFSHEVQGPLSMLSQLSSKSYQLKEIDNDAELNENLLLIKDYSTYTHEVVVRVLSWIREEISKKPGNKSHIEIKSVIRRILSFYKPDFTRKGIQVTLDIEDAAKTVLTNDIFLEIILKNIISNATKFTNSKINIRAEQHIENKIKISVEDNGDGVKNAETLEALNNGIILKSTIGKHGEVGYGVGLMIVTDLIRQNKNEILFENIDHGFRVSIYF